MAEIQSASGSSQHLHRGRRSRKAPLKVDLTPMVDLAFLLITFFMLSMQMRDQGALEWRKQISDIQEPVPDSCVLNILVDSANRVFTYDGQDLKTLKLTSFSQQNGLEQVVKAKSIKVKTYCGLTHSGKPHDIICLLKLLPGARYQNLTDVVDVMNVTQTACYSIQDPLPDEVAELKARSKELLAAD